MPLTNPPQRAIITARAKKELYQAFLRFCEENKLPLMMEVSSLSMGYGFAHDHSISSDATAVFVIGVDTNILNATNRARIMQVKVLIISSFWPSK